MDKRLESFSNEELLKAVIENILEHEIGSSNVDELTDEQRWDMIDSVYKNREVIDDLVSDVYDKLADYRNDEDNDEQDNDEVDETNYNPYMGQDDISNDYNENYF